MSEKLLPFNIELLVMGDELLRGIRPVRVLDIFDGLTKNFHPEGLFSTTIFGKVGEERRNRAFSYIDLKVSIIHPVVYNSLISMKQLYGGIVSGKEYAIWDPEVSDFVPSTPIDGRTGYNFFMEHCAEIVFEERDSEQRKQKIALEKKYLGKPGGLFSKLVVMPAGLRDYEIDETGKPTEDEINTFYRKALGLSNLITPAGLKVNPESLDGLRYNMQVNMNNLYDYIQSLLEGKKKLVLGKWASRVVFNGTRNVITSLINTSSELGGKKTVGFNQTVIGLYQFLKATLPLSIYHIRNGFLANVFSTASAPMFLVNKKTLKKEMVEPDPDLFDSWMTEEGLEKTITRFGEEPLRHMFLETDTHYLGLIYKGPNGTYKLMQDIGELPDWADKKDVHPITFAELLYLSVYHFANTIPGYVTRYPITGYGSIYPSMTYLKSTVKSDTRKELNDHWEETGEVAHEFPVYKTQFVNSLSPHPTHLKRLGADFDGDTCSYNAVYTEEAIAEVGKFLNSRRYYVGSSGEISFSADTDTIGFVLQNMTF